jgi:hypothetical protein
MRLRDIAQLKKLFKIEPKLYRLWFWVNKHRLSDSLRLPKSTDDFYFDGFPRSGNTYVVSFLKRFYSDCQFSHHLHTVASLKIALSRNLESIILLRNPSDTVASLCIMQSYYGKGTLQEDKFLNNILDEYIIYYDFVLENIYSLRILPFQSIINIEDLPKSLSSISSTFNRIIPKKDLISFDL